MCTAVASVDGTFTCQGTIPKRSRAGRRGLKTITGVESGGMVATTVFTLIGKTR
jgi:hypothetical protein